ncbi:MAG TPA: capsular biosynthesis protein [Rhodobacteraceae bacterium]|nr:capsular biosynthesis protein [Paracoccaceae bacterium]
MNFIFPMGGLSKRFTDAGYTVPKFMLDLHGSTVFEHAVIGFQRYFAEHNFVFAFRDDPAVETFVREKCQRLGIPAENLHIVKLSAPTSGQAETVWLALKAAGLRAADPIIIFNIDSFQSDYQLPKALDLETTAGYLEVFQGEGEHWSFVLPGPDASATRVTEKDRVSDLCSTGLYYFQHAADFNAAFEQTLNMDVANLQGGERYVAPLYNTLISANKPVKYHLVPASEVTFCGTPDEYETLRRAAPPPTSAALAVL